MKVLVLCRAGIARSHAMLRELKEQGLHDTLAAGVEVNSPETLEMLYRWADRIVLMSKDLAPRIPDEQAGKLVLADVGPDVWGSPDEPDLRRRVRVIAEEWKKDGWRFSNLSLRPKG